MMRFLKNRKLRRELKTVKEKYVPLLNQAMQAHDSNQYIRLSFEYEPQAGKLRTELESPKTDRVVKTARSFGIEPPSLENRDYWDKIPSTDVYVLTKYGLAHLKRQISTARFSYWKQWSEIIVPILALIVAIIALLKSK
jgi:hypothetical protein